MIKDLSYLVISDIHLGHKKTSCYDIVQHLDSYLEHYASNTIYSELDMVIIAGDLFDRLLDFNSGDIHEATIWIDRLMKFCSRHKLILRVLEGTPSHDWKQSKIVDTLKDVSDYELDVRYIDTLHIEHIESLDISVLYVPDEWTASTDLTYSQVQELLKEQGLSQVDIAIMHGCFSYQVQHLPVKLDSHSETNYLAIVKHAINIGHFHKYSTYDRIIAQGSFDRLAHGEEEPKGGVIVSIFKDLSKETEHVFIENKLAKVYKTISIRYKELEKALRSLYRTLDEIPPRSHVRIKASKDHPIYQSLDEVKLRYPSLSFTKITEESIEESKAMLSHDLYHADYVPIMITPENINTLLLDRVKEAHPLTDTQLKEATHILETTLTLVT